MSQRLPVVKPKRVIRALERAGFFVHHSTGSHYLLKHPDHPIPRVTVAYHNRDLKRKTLATIIDQADLSVEKFIELL
jgi:predicted RNA binding protein YcfA (HicA-like mRNA interferase family)